jgi:hypothetical protein
MPLQGASAMHCLKDLGFVEPNYMSGDAGGMESVTSI